MRDVLIGANLGNGRMESRSTRAMRLSIHASLTRSQVYQRVQVLTFSNKLATQSQGAYNLTIAAVFS